MRQYFIASVVTMLCLTGVINALPLMNGYKLTYVGKYTNPVTSASGMTLFVDFSRTTTFPGQTIQYLEKGMKGKLEVNSGNVHYVGKADIIAPGSANGSEIYEGDAPGKITYGTAYPISVNVHLKIYVWSDRSAIFFQAPSLTPSGFPKALLIYPSVLRINTANPTPVGTTTAE